MHNVLKLWTVYRYLKVAHSGHLKVIFDMLTIPQLDYLQANLWDVLNLKRLNKRALHPYYLRRARRK